MADAPPPAADGVAVEPPEGKKHVCGYLEGHVGYRKRYVGESEALGRLMAADGVGLVYGGARVGPAGSARGRGRSGPGRVGYAEGSVVHESPA